VTTTDGNHSHLVAVDAAGSHSHTGSTSVLNSGVPQHPLSLVSKTFNVSCFVYLGTW
jgi:hypothetical protein